MKKVIKTGAFSAILEQLDNCPSDSIGEFTQIIVNAWKNDINSNSDEFGVKEAFYSLFTHSNTKIVVAALDDVESLLRSSHSVVEWTRRIDEEGGVDCLDNLQNHESQEVYERV